MGRDGEGTSRLQALTALASGELVWLPPSFRRQE
jgi:hypothetical protein